MATREAENAWRVSEAGKANLPTDAVSGSPAASISTAGRQREYGTAVGLSTPNVLVGRGCRITGKLELSGGAEIQGAVEGEIISSGELVIHEQGVIAAKIQGTSVRVFGRVKGDISCSDRLELHAGACVTGNLQSPILVIREGVVFEGHCSMPEAGTGPEKVNGPENAHSSTIGADDDSEELEENS